MEIKENFVYKNECYKANRHHKVRGIMIHSTGTNQTSLSVWHRLFNALRPQNRQVCVHAFIGLDDDGEVKTMQTLPWDSVGWHSGSGFLDWSQNANNTGYIGIELCEDDLSDGGYLDRVISEAADVCAYLCKKYGIDEKSIICHAEGHRKGIASNHADVEHWFSRHKKTMDAFRADVRARVTAEQKGTVKEENDSFEVGDKVKIARFTDEDKKRAYTYTGGTFRAYFDVYDILSMRGDRIVIGRGRVVTAAVNARDIVKAGDGK
ncbi:MAG: N-acetylmuramoyl-L-alanine amidase [Clostridia bacterium]|nr:N-acetylmuramoyl-L-alanine amidase [Clostridia bacterium]